MAAQEESEPKEATPQGLRQLSDANVQALLHDAQHRSWVRVLLVRLGLAGVASAAVLRLAALEESIVEVEEAAPVADVVGVVESGALAAAVIRVVEPEAVEHASQRFRPNHLSRR